METSNFEDLFNDVVEHTYKAMLKYIQGVCENPENAWCILTQYEGDHMELLYGRNAQIILDKFKNEVAKAATNRIIMEVKQKVGKEQ